MTPSIAARKALALVDPGRCLAVVLPDPQVGIGNVGEFHVKYGPRAC